MAMPYGGTFRSVFLLVLLAAAGASRRCAVAQGEISSGLDPALKQELEFARGLLDWGMADYAETVLKKVNLDAVPEGRALWRRMQIEGKLALAKFDEVKAIIAREANQDSLETWGMKLLLGDYYFAHGRYVEAREVFDAFFAKYPDKPPEGLNAFYLESAYKYAQMQLHMGNRKAALAAYQRVRKAKMEPHVERQVLGETSELLLKLAEESKDKAERQKYFKEIEKINNVIMWIQDLWFGKAIVIMAHVKLLENDHAGAAKLITDYGDALKQIDESLKQQEQQEGEPLSRLSPMAEVRYLLGLMRQESAEKMLAEGGDRAQALAMLIGDAIPGDEKKRRSNGAVHEFTRVFINYPNTAWAPECGRRLEKIRELLDREFKLKIQTNVTDEKMAKVREVQFQNMRSVFFQQKYKEAAEGYEELLALFPDTEDAMGGLEDLAKCYVELGEELYAQMAISYLAERFSADRNLMVKAGNAVLRMAFLYDERKAPHRRDATYKTFFHFYAQHPRASALLYRFGEEQFAATNYVGALDFFSQVVSNYPSAPTYPDALSRVAACYAGLDDQSNTVRVLEQQLLPLLEKKERPGQDYVVARYRLATATRKLGDLRATARHYDELIKALSETPERFRNNEEEAARNRDLLEACVYYKAMLLLRIPPSEKADQSQLRQMAIDSLLAFVARYPKSAYAAPALNQVGTLYTVAENPAEAEKAFRRLDREYPDSPEARNSKFLLGTNLLQMGQRKRAVDVFKEMFAEGGSGGRYTSAQVLASGEELLKAGEAEIALDAFNALLAKEKDRLIQERALVAKGKALIALRRWDEGRQVLEDMLKANPRSGFTVEASLQIARAYGEIASTEANADSRTLKFNEAVKALNKAKKFERTREGIARIDLTIARIYVQKARAEKKFGTPAYVEQFMGTAVAAYLGLTAGDASDAAVRPLIEDAFNECLPLLAELKKWDEVLEDSARYEELFPGGRHLIAVRRQRDTARMSKVMEGVSSGAAAPAPAPEGQGGTTP